MPNARALYGDPRLRPFGKYRSPPTVEIETGEPLAVTERAAPQRIDGEVLLHVQLVTDDPKALVRCE